MSAVTRAAVELEPDVEARTRTVGSRLLLAVNASVQLSFLFAFLYLRGNNFNGMWHPSGVSAPPAGIGVAAMLLQVLSLVAVWMALQQLRRRADFTPLAGLFAVGLVLGLASLGIRIFQLLHTGWLPSNGTYADTSVTWLALIALEIFLGLLWMTSLLMGHVRRTAAVTFSGMRAAAEYWLFVTAVAVGMFLLVQFVT